MGWRVAQFFRLPFRKTRQNRRHKQNVFESLRKANNSGVEIKYFKISLMERSKIAHLHFLTKIFFRIRNFLAAAAYPTRLERPDTPLSEAPFKIPLAQ